MRQVRSLNGQWQFQVDPAGTITPTTFAPERPITVPMPWQAAYPELEQYSGYAWYSYALSLEQAVVEEAGELLLHFGAVDYWCQVFVNGELAGQHEGGYMPFDVPIKAWVKPGSNQLLVRVYDSVQHDITIPRWPDYPAHTTSNQPPFDAAQLPHGKQEWYINVGGIWQDVTLIAVPATYLENVQITPDIHTGEAHFSLTLAGDTAHFQGEFHLRVNKVETRVSCIPGTTQYRATLKIDQPQLWSVQTPNLYSAQITLDNPSGAADNSDSLEIRFGFREIVTHNGQILLNGQPIFLLAALDQDIYADTIYTVPSVEYLRDQFRKAKELGFNCLRCHIKPPDPRYLDLADEMGLLVWTEIPSWRTFYPRGTIHPNQLVLDELIKQRVEQILREMIARDFNHPSIIIWTLVNEDWGTALAFETADRSWLSQLYDYCKQLDPTRLVVDNSACLNITGPNIHVHSDLDDFHFYAGIPEQADTWEQIIEQFNLRPTWTYSTHNDIVRTGREPLVLSEFGNWGLPSLQLMHQHYGKEPDWFKLGPWWSLYEGETGWPKEVLKRFDEFGLAQIWEDYEEFATASQWHQFAAMKFEIEVMRRQPNLAGYVVTELADIYWESNGLLDFLRNPKAYHDVFATINSPDVIIPQATYQAVWDDQTLTLQLHLAHYSGQDWKNARLFTRLDVAEKVSEYALPTILNGSVKTLGSQRWRFAKVAQAAFQKLDFMLQSSTGNAQEEILARNSLEVLVLPAAARPPQYLEQLAVITRAPMWLANDLEALARLTLGNGTGSESQLEDADQLQPADISQPDHKTGYHLENLLQGLGYHTTPQLNSTSRVAITNYPNAELLEWVQQGGDLLFLSNGPSPFFWVRTSGGSNSSWISAFTWLKPGIHKRLSTVPNPVSMAFRHVMPRASIAGLPYKDPAVQADFLAGSITGWLNHPAINTLQFRYGQGRVIMTTFALERALPGDPVAVAMLHDLIEYLQSDACQPTLRADVSQELNLIAVKQE